MSMFPTAHSVVYYNDAGEPLGWDTPTYDDEPDNEDYLGSSQYDDYLFGFAEELAAMTVEQLLAEHAKNIGRDEMDLVHEELDNRGLSDPCPSLRMGC